MANQLTPAERMRLAQRLQAQKSARMGLSAPVASDLSYYLPNDTADVRPAAAVKKPLSQQVRGAGSKGGDEAEWYDRAGATVLDVGAKLGVNAFSALEGIYDMGAGLIGEIGGWFSEDFKRAVDEHTEYDASEALEKTLDDLGLKHSYLNEDGLLGFADDVIGVVGGMLPAVVVGSAITAATAGAAAPVALGMTGAQLASLGTMAAGAAGQSMEEAQKEGADLGKALNYGLVSGAIEAGTEKLTGGLTKGLFGKGVLDGGEAVAKTGAKRIFKGMVEEGVEEGIASVASPLAKTTYKGTEALKEYTEPEFVGNVLKDVGTGAVTAAVYGGTVGKITHTSGKDADISAAQESVAELQKKRRTLQAEGSLGDAQKAQLNEYLEKNLSNVSKTLKNASDAERQKLIKRHNLENKFDERGEIKPEFAAKMFGGATTLQSNTNGSVKEGLGLDERYYTADMWGDEQRVENDIQKVSDKLGSEVVPYSGELTETEAQNMRSLYSAANVLSDHTNTGVGVAIVDSGGKMNGAILSDSNIIMIDKAKLADGSWADALVHEMTHFSEGSKSYSKLMSFFAEDTELVDNVLNQIAGEGSSYGFTDDTVKSIIRKNQSGEALTEEEKSLRDELGAHMTAEVLGTESFMQKVIKGDVSLAEKIINRIQALSDAFSKSDSPEVRAQKKRIAKAEKLWMKAVDEAGYKYVGNKLISAIKDEEEKEKSASSTENVQEAETLDNGEASEYNDDVQFSRKSRTKKYIKISQYAREQLNRKLIALYRGIDDGIADDIAIDIGNIVYIVDSGKDRGNISFGVSEMFEFDDEKYKADFVRSRNDDTISKMHISDELSERLGGGLGYNRKSNLQSEHRSDLSDDKQQSENNSQGVQGEIRGSENRDRVRGINEEAQFSLPNRATDTAYLKAVEEGNMETAQRMVDEAAKKAGYTVKAYHGTRAEFTVFSKDTIGSGATLFASQGKGFYFAADKETASKYAKGGKVLSARLKLEKPFVFKNKRNQEVNKLLKEFAELHGQTFDIKDYDGFVDFEKRTGAVLSRIVGGNGEAFTKFLQSKGYDGIEYVSFDYDTRAGIECYVVFDPQNIKSADPVTYDEDGNVIPLSKRFDSSQSDIRFSLSTKQESDGARAKANANRSRSKTYTRAEAAAIMNAVAEGATDAEGNPIRIKGQKGKIIDALWERLNKVDENSGKRGGMALDIADHMIRASVVEDLEYDPSEEVYLERLDALNGYRNKLDLSSLRGEIKHAYDDKSGRVYLTWGKKDGGMTPDMIKAELAERGIVIEADNPADILFEVDRMYTEAREYFKQKTNARLSDWMNADELNAYRQSLAQKILKETVGKGSTSNLARDYQRREADFKRREAFMKEEISRMRKDFKASSDLVYKVGKLRNQLTDGIKKQHSVKSFNDPRFKGSLGKLTGMTRAGQLLDKNTRKIFASVNEWYTKENELFRDSQTEDGKIEPNRYYNEEVKACIDALAKGKGRLTGDDIKRADLAVSYFSKLIESYNMVYRNGRYVDAVEIAKKNIANVKRTKLLKRGMMHKIYQKGLADIVDPVTLMRYADGYESGFFVETFKDLRRGAMEMAFTRMDLMEDYEAFFKEHKDYPKRMEETVEFRDVKIPRNVLLSAYMTSKREHSHKGFVESGMTFKDPKTGDGVRIAPLGDPSVDYTDNEIKTMIANMQKEMEAHFNDTDRAYISMVEKIFDRCADIKTETDMHRLGFTNVDKDAYYYPIARATRPINLDSDSVLEAMERVNSLSMNKDTVKGANAMLYIDTVDAVFRRHVNQVSLYHGLADAVDNFNKLVNLNVNDGPGVPISVNTELDSAFGKIALNYLRTMKNDIEGMATLSESDRKLQKFITDIRGKYATFQLGFNPKVWATQLSSVLSASNLLDPSAIARGLTMYGGHEKGVEADVDKYCRLAKLRNTENTVVEAQSVMKRSTNKLTELSMKPIGGVDRFVINRLWGACQAQVEANHKGDSSMKIGKEANKKEAGRLLERVILETQQNSLMTERSGWMRSKNEFAKGLTMFSADAMKNVGRVFDGIGEIHVLKQELKSETLTENERKALESRLKEARKRAVRASAALIANAVFMAAVALFFQSLLRQNEDKEPEEIAQDFGVDAIGNLLGGIPVLRDVYGFFANGYEIDNFLLSTMNDFLTTAQSTTETFGKVMDGTASTQDVAKSVRDLVYSTGQLSGLPFRNLYKYSTGLIARISPSAGYWIGSQFKHNPYRADLKKAIEAGDTHMISTIAGLITDENYSNQSKETKEALRALVAEGHVVLPRTLSDTVTVNNETVKLTDAQKAKMQHVYAASDKAVDELVSMQMFKDATDEEKAKALGKIYDLYYNLAVDHALELDTEERSVLFAEVLDVELLAIIAARANELKADVDKAGKAVSGSRKAKVTKLVSSLKLTAAEKYMVMGYLGYKNVNGKNQVQSRINKSSLSRTEKEKLLAYCGY